jgi:hypothetical protein
MEPQSCPMCSRHSVEPPLGDVTISAQLDRERLLGGIRAYRCTEMGHIFFVRVKEIEVPRLPSTPQKVPLKPCAVCHGTGECTARAGSGELPF